MLRHDGKLESRQAPRGPLSVGGPLALGLLAASNTYTPVQQQFHRLDSVTSSPGRGAVNVVPPGVSRTAVHGQLERFAGFYSPRKMRATEPAQVCGKLAESPARVPTCTTVIIRRVLARVFRNPLFQDVSEFVKESGVCARVRSGVHQDYRAMGNVLVDRTFPQLSDAPSWGHHGSLS